MEKRQKSALESGVLILIAAGILIAINALSGLGLYVRADVTKTERFTLSKGSGNLLRSMKQQVFVDAYVTRGLPKLDAFVRDLRDLLQEYKDAGHGKFAYSIIEPKDDDTRKRAKDAGLIEQPFGETSATDERAAVTQGFMGLVLRYGEQQDVIKFLSPDRTEGLEFWITNKIREVRDKGDDIHHKVGVLTGHDEIKTTEANLAPANMGKFAMQGIITQNFPFYSFQDVDLKGGDTEIPDDLDGLLITQPAKILTDKELRRIDQFVMKGKSLVVFAGAANLKANDATMTAQLDSHGVEKLLAGYGIEMNKDVVLDLWRRVHVIVPTAAGITPLDFPQVLQVQDDPRFSGDHQLVDTSFAALFRIEDVVVPFPSSLTLKSSAQPPGVTMRAVLRSSPLAVHLTNDTLDLRPFQKWAPKLKGLKQEQFTVGADVEGTLKSAFAGTPGGDLGIAVPEESVKPARVFVVASPQFLANPFARSGAGPDMGQYGAMMPNAGGDEQLLMAAGPYAQQFITGTILVFKNTLDWISGDTDLLAVSAKLTAEPNLNYGDLSKVKISPDETEEQLRKQEEEVKAGRKTQQHTIESFLILGLPALFAIFGLLRWRWRTNARTNVALA